MPVTLPLWCQTIGTTSDPAWTNATVEAVSCPSPTFTITIPVEAWWRANAGFAATAAQTQTQTMWYHTITAYHTAAAQSAANQAYRRGVADAQQANLWRPAVPPARLAAPAIRRGRRALRRSLEIFRRIRGPEELATFLAGDWLTVRGHRYDYQMKRRQNLLSHTMQPNVGHVPYDFRVIDKATQQPLATGCVVYCDTPVVDQLLAVIMAIQHPSSEDDLIETTNWSRTLPHQMRLAA